MFSAWRQLRKLGIVGINERNADMILKYNRRRFYPLVDDKLKTKKLAIEHNIQAPQLFAKLETEHDIKQLDKILAQHNDFVIKPAQGAGGDGIIVITSQVRGRYRKSNGQLVDIEFLRHHCSNILAGLFSLGGHSDVAMIEQRIQAADVFSAVSFQGVPDVRVIVFRGSSRKARPTCTRAPSVLASTCRWVRPLMACGTTNRSPNIPIPATPSPASRSRTGRKFC
jgi:alpha-L-glutamate ligase-like protein